MSDLYGKNTDTISYHIKNIKNGAVTEDYSDTEASFPVTGDDGKTYNVKHYNQYILLQVGYKCNIEVANRFKEWVDSLFNEGNTTNITNNWISEAKNYEIVKFESGEVSLDVNVSSNEDTVWLSRQQIAILFDRDIKTVSKHINSALEEECKGVTVAKNAIVQIEVEEKKECAKNAHCKFR